MRRERNDRRLNEYENEISALKTQLGKREIEVILQYNDTNIIFWGKYA